MTVAAEAIVLVNAAISRTGGNFIATDFGTGVSTDGVEKNLAYLNYERIVKAELLSAPYRFARKTDDCVIVVTAPDDTFWKYAWTLPTDLLGLRTIIRNGCVIPYELNTAGEVLTNFSDDVLAIYTYRALESVWPADFSEGITCRLEAVYLRNDSRFSEADDRDAAANAVFSRARLNHSQEEAPSDRRRHPLISARRIGRAACHN